MKIETVRTRDLRLRLGLALGILLLVNAGALAEDAPKINSADFVKEEATGEPYIAISFAPSFKQEHESRILDEKNYRVSRINAGRAGNDRFLGIEKVTIDPDENFNGATPKSGRSSVRVYLAAPYDFAPGETITIYYLGLGPDGKMMFADKEIKAALVAVAIVPKAPDPSSSSAQSNASGGSQKLAPTGKGFALKAAKGRDDSDIYFSGDINRSSGTDFTGSVDMKVQIPVVSTAIHTVRPRFELKASNDPKADPDSLRAGLDWDWVLAGAKKAFPPGSPISGIIWRNSGGFESDRDFNNENLVWTTQIRFRFRNVPLSRTKEDPAYAVFIPQLGAELGKNVNSPVREAEGHAIARLVAGSNVYVRLYQGTATFARVSLDGLYQRRWPLEAEVGLQDVTVKDANGKDVKKTVAAFFGKAPRQWADVKLNYNLTDYFGLFVGYQYGQLPPIYKLVNHAFKFGLVFKAKLK